MSEKKRMFRKITEAKAKIIWSTCKQDSLTGKWKGVSKASRLTGVTRQTIYDFLQEYPKAKVTRKIQPKYVEKWEKTQGYQQIIDWHKKRTKVTKTTLNTRLSFARECWKHLKHKDPVSWTIDDFHKLKENPAFFDIERARQKKREPVITANKLVMLRSIIKAVGELQWLEEFPTVGTKKEPGQKIDWWLRKGEIEKIKAELDEISTYTLFEMAINTGGRIGSYLFTTISELHLENEGGEWWNAFESKGGRHTKKVLNSNVVRQLKKYLAFLRSVNMANPEHRLFPRGKNFYTKKLKEAGKRAGICYTGTDSKTKKIRDDMIHGHTLSWHITRHTFATHLAIQKVPLNYIMQQGPWKDASTLLGFYAGADPTEMREYLNKLNL